MPWVAWRSVFTGAMVMDGCGRIVEVEVLLLLFGVANGKFARLSWFSQVDGVGRRGNCGLIG